MALSKHPYLYKAIREAIEKFGERHHITGRQHFAPLLGFSGPNGHIQLGTYLNYTNYNPAAPHPFNIDHLSILLDELGEDRSVILNALAKEFDMVVVPRRLAHTKSSDINALVDMANIENSDVFKVVKKAIEDGVVTKEERASILKEINEAQIANAALKDTVSHLIVKKEE